MQGVFGNFFGFFSDFFSFFQFAELPRQNVAGLVVPYVAVPFPRRRNGGKKLPVFVKKRLTEARKYAILNVSTVK